MPCAMVMLMGAGCTPYPALHYAVRADTMDTLRALKTRPVNMGAFTAATPGQSKIMCRCAGPVQTPDGEPFSEYVRKAIVDDLRIANLYDEHAPVTLTGHLEAIDFSSNAGAWHLVLVVKSSNGTSITLSESYPFPTSLYGTTACTQAAHALMPAVQNLARKLFQSPEFETLLRP